MKSPDWKRLAAILFCALCAGAVLCLCLRFLLPPALPFLIAALLAYVCRWGASRLSPALRIPGRVLSAVLLTLLFALLGLTLALSLRALISEGSALISSVFPNEIREEDTEEESPEGEEAPAEDPGNSDRRAPSGFWASLSSGESLFSALGLSGRWNDGPEQLLERFLSSLLASLASALPSLLAGVAASLPKLLFSAVVTVIAGYWFCLSPGVIPDAVFSFLPASAKTWAKNLKEKAKQLSFGYLRAYALLFLITYAELFLGFRVLNIPLAFLLSLLIALVDLLPILGVGTVLIPWGILMLIRGNTRLGIGLLILYLVILTVRQILEPRLLGKSLGLPPIATLAAGYAGFSLFGFFGMLAGPLVLLFLGWFFTQLKTILPEKQAQKPTS